MTNEWKPTNDQKNGVICRTVEFIVEEVDELMQELNCPPSYIAELLRVIADDFENDSNDKESVDDPKLDFFA